MTGEKPDVFGLVQFGLVQFGLGAASIVVAAMGPETEIAICDFGDARSRSVPAELPLNAVHVWWRSLQANASDIGACHELLSGEERERASRYRVDRPRNDFILTRATLRTLLAGYLHKTPQELEFRLTPYGKPFLDGADLFFNVSHTDGLALLAFARERRIGADVERIRPEPDAKQLAERFFSVRERQSLENLSGSELQAAFFRCWTRKEAYIKARGEGLSLPLDQFDVSVEANESRVLLATRPDAAEAGRWLVHVLPTSPEYAAAVAVAATSGG